ncbi:MAG: hypothetical protein H0U54_04430 [Acidobacteria bacterium]|nr:hypothetical protein [Acidobacteriota bacterium]
MITGFNTDVEHEGVVYHVQTEDKGLKSPLILSLVYVGGTILASKRTPYEDLIATGFEEDKLADRLQRQHKLICAAIHAGRIEDLKRQTEREASARAKPPEPEAKIEEPQIIQEIPQAAPEQEEEVAEEESDLIQLGNIADFMPPPVITPPPVVQSKPAAPEAIEVNPGSQFEQVDYSRVVDYEGAIVQADTLQITLLDEKKFVAGEFVKLNVHVGGGAAENPEGATDASVTLKVLGTSFRPLIFSGKTGADGIATFYAMLPYFTSGRAAILVNASVKGHKAELRRVIHQA